MKFIVVKPRGDAKSGDSDKTVIDYDLNKIKDKETFIRSQVGDVVMVEQIGDYFVWFNEPRGDFYTEQDELVKIPLKAQRNLPNILINENYLAHGNVVFTANAVTCDGDNLYGLDDQDYAIIINAFMSTGHAIVEHGDDEAIVVDRVFDGLLNVSQTDYDNYDYPEIEELEIPDKVEGTGVEFEYTDEEYNGSNEYYKAPRSGSDEDFNAVSPEELEAEEQKYLSNL
ncbi:hypothetical protein [Staphylococcus capitis]|uniref:hypothetical protein n=1 Tax=Staphylococcus capitis TaxID=29388 RepID=UPI003CE69730